MTEEEKPVFMVRGDVKINDVKGKPATIPKKSLWTFKEKAYVNNVDSKVFQSFPDEEKEITIPNMMVGIIMKEVIDNE